MADESNQDNRTPEQIAADAAAETARIAAEAAKNKTVYTAEELENLHPTAIDIERVDPAARPIVEKTIKEYKSLQGDHTKKSQELAELKKTQGQEQESFFEDPKKDGVFKDYLKNPLKVVGDINAEIANLEAVIPEDGADEYRKARRQIAYWNGIKDEFSTKRIEVSEKHRKTEVDEAKLAAELGDDLPTLQEYAKTLGFSEADFKRKPEIRIAVKNAYKITHADESGGRKEVKPRPHVAGRPAGQAGGGAGGESEEDETNLSVSERIKRSEARLGHG